MPARLTFATLLCFAAVSSASAQVQDEKCDPVKEQSTAVVKSGDNPDKPVIPVTQPAPKYPADLLSKGITGKVSLSFVVNTEGKAEKCSIKIESTSNQRFVESAKAMILASTFKPAELGGTPVRAVAKQNVNFTAGNR